MTRFVMPMLITMLLFLTGCRMNNGGQQVSYDALPAGQKLFLLHCVSCHMGSGDPPWPNDVVMNSHFLGNEADFIHLLRQPRSPMMRAFGEKDLDQEAVHELYDYLQGLRTHQGR